ncbi:Hypothetical_protein [Hexamita inflata]|uniref:Hypothetical_protein n=1 Tax=Hexamita inflata TaxID=28002 RepID=A0AA86PW37_9EUKA|nr:Hypothetical protein HINF_LOCUS29812 [Hexamita inflata]
MHTFQSISETQLERCQQNVMPGNAFNLAPIVLQFCYIQIDDIEANQREPHEQVCETQVQIYDQQNRNLVYYGGNLVYQGQYYILKRGVQYAIQRIHFQDTEQIYLHFEHKVSGIWTPDFKLTQQLQLPENSDASEYNLKKFQDNTIQIQRMGETRLTAENKYEILDLMYKRKEQNIKYTEPRRKQSPVKIYIKIIFSEQYPVNNINNYVRVKIVSKEKNKLQYGDYYELQLNQEYCLFTTLEPQEEFSLVFNEKVSFEWIPDFPIVPESSSDIQIMRRGEYLPQNQYFFDNIQCLEKVSVIAQNTIRLIKEPLQNQDYNKLEFKPRTYIKRHEPLVITQLYGDLGFTTYKGLDGWVCLRYLSQFGKESACYCEKCYPFYIQKQPFELYQPKQPLLKIQIINDQIQRQRNQVIDDQILRQMFMQYNQCECSHCQEVRSNFEGQNIFESFIDPQTEMVKHFYQKRAQCINYEHITAYINASFQTNFEKEKIQKRFLEYLLQKMKKQIPDEMMEEFHKLSSQIPHSQMKIIKRAVVYYMSILMKDYDPLKVKEKLKNWISYNKLDTELLSDEQIYEQVQIIVNKICSQLEDTNAVKNQLCRIWFQE